MKRFEKFRREREAVYAKNFSSRSLCIAGLLAMPFFLLNPSALSRTAQFLFFWFLNWLSGKKNNALITVIVLLGIVSINLFVPYGRVLASIGVFKITEGALNAGIKRAVTLEGLVMLSRVCIKRGLKIRGIFGELLAESFRIFARITDSKQRISRKNLAGDIDALMLELSAEEELPAGEQTAGMKTNAGGIAVLAAAVLLTLLLGLLGPAFQDAFTSAWQH